MAFLALKDTDLELKTPCQSIPKAMGIHFMLLRMRGEKSVSSKLVMMKSLLVLKRHTAQSSFFFQEIMRAAMKRMKRIGPKNLL
eukprot:15366827-Ditylum_brightwellii.AAC.2